MDNFSCENCGSNNIVEENGIATCQACGTKYPDLKLKNIGLDEELKENEIKRLIEVNNKKFLWNKKDLEPKIGILTDDEILKYSPNSHAAKKIIAKRSGKLIDKLKAYGDYIGVYYFILGLVFFFVIIFVCGIFGNSDGVTIVAIIFLILIFIIAPLIILKYYID